MRVLLLATAVTALKIRNDLPAAAAATQDYGFMGEGTDLPDLCGVKTITDGQTEYLSGLHGALGQRGVRTELPTVFNGPLKCWYAKMMYKDGCGDLQPGRSGTQERRALQEKCRDPKVGFAALFADKSVTEAERLYLLSNYPNQKDADGNPVPGAYSEVMNILYTVGGKEVLCQSLDLIDNGCKDIGPFVEY